MPKDISTGDKQPANRPLSSPPISRSEPMKPIQMVDLSTQYQRIKPEVDAAIQRVIDHAQFINGPEVKTFEKDLATYNGSRHVVACGNGTDALQIAMMALGLKPGDEVITPSFTFAATVEVIALLGLTPVYAEVHPRTFLMDPEDVARKITPLTKAIVPVHLFGQVAPMEQLLRLAEERGLYVIEDNAQAIGAMYTFSDGSMQRSGAMGHVATTSFFPSKNLGGYGDGGALFTNDDDIARKLRRVCNHGSEKRYYHEVVGVNSRLDTLQAAILGVKLKYLDDYAAARNRAAAYYDAAFHGMDHVHVPERSPLSTHVFHQYTLRITGGHRDGLRQHLEANGVPSMIYYPVPCHLQKAYHNADFPAGSLAVTEQLAAEVLSLPMSTELDDEQLAHITATVKSYFN